MFYVGLSFLMMYLANFSSDIFYVGALILVGVLFTVLAEIELIRRLVFPRVLELTDDTVLFPHGFLWTRVTAIRYDGIIRIKDYEDSLEFEAVADNGQCTIQASYFTDLESYCTVREFIGIKSSIVLSCYAKDRRRRWMGFPPHLDLRCVELPSPLTQWVEPEDWVRYRTQLVNSKPILARLGREAWFFANCWGFILFPWFLLWLSSQHHACSFKSFLALSVVATFICTIFHWLDTTYPVRRGTEISLRNNGITMLLCNGQIKDWHYHSLYGWAVIEREYRGNILHILLLKGHGPVEAFALPDAGVGDRVKQILVDKRVPQLPGLEPPW